MPDRQRVCSGGDGSGLKTASRVRHERFTAVYRQTLLHKFLFVLRKDVTFRRSVPVHIKRNAAQAKAEIGKTVQGKLEEQGRIRFEVDFPVRLQNPDIFPDKIRMGQTAFGMSFFSAMDR